MKQKLFSCLTGVFLFVASASVAQAACVAEYKAKSDKPLKLFFSTAQISGPCTVGNATKQLRSQLAAQGLTLLKVVSVREG